jgi:hypothetical protein
MSNARKPGQPSFRTELLRVHEMAYDIIGSYSPEDREETRKWLDGIKQRIIAGETGSADDHDILKMQNVALKKHLSILRKKLRSLVRLSALHELDEAPAFVHPIQEEEETES